MSNDIAIKVENLSKRYKIGARQQGYKTLRESIMGALASPFCRLVQIAKQKAPNDASHAPNALANPMPSARCPMPSSSDDTIWALKDVSFEVKRGEVVGIIGRNGAGKTTLLKILSRITEPTEGRAEIYGRVGSLLEVGTGFHPELTGRENIYLNGAILGMRKVEIERKFDEIVDFAEIEKFIDTPVKRYSSGMFVRLAFSVAAHLEPEILLVDEVLAVGDAVFQKKCLGKMGDVARGGRTVFFVSHNMAAVSALCSKGILLEEGRISASGRTEDIALQYLSHLENQAQVDLSNRKDRRGSGRIRLVRITILDENDREVNQVLSGQTIRVVLQYQCQATVFKVSFAFSVYNSAGILLFSCDSWHVDFECDRLTGGGLVCCTIPRLCLPGGAYRLNAAIYETRRDLCDHVEGVALFQVLDGDFWGTGRLPADRPGLLLVEHMWSVE